MRAKKYIWKSITWMLFCSFVIMSGIAEAKSVKANNNSSVSTKPAVSAEKKSVKKSKPKDTSKAAAKGDNTKVESNGWKVRVAQQKLRLLGFSQEKPNGRLTEETAKALTAFQRAYKLPASGKLDGATYNKLNWLAFTKEGINNIQGKDIVQSASKYKGVPYVFGGTTPKGFDCSGYVQFIFRKHNAQLPRVADEQVLKGIFVTQKQLKPGDLVFFTTYAPGASHVGIYAGNGQFWHTSSSRGVMLSSLQDVYWKPRYYGARRVLVSNGEI